VYHPLRALSARRARRVAARAAAAPCCFGRCTTADRRAREQAARPAVEHVPALRLPHHRTEES
jgi:hypothetical protein